MWTRCLTLTFLLVPLVSAANRGHADLADFCIREAFEAQCAEDEIVQIQEARYGRMSAGRCISQEYGHIGCSNDVTTYLDGLCSGRHQCSSNVRLLMDIAQPCPKDFTSYLQASYTCSKVAMGNREECHRNNYVTLREPQGNLATMITEETGFGSAGCPWRIRVLPGQKVNLTLYDFNRPWSFAVAQGNAPRDDQSDGCAVSLVVEDGREKVTIKLCDSADRRRHLYVSQTNDVLVHFAIRTMMSKHFYYMVNFKAVECPDLQVPAGAWQRREGDNARVQCNSSGEVWYLTCRDGHWIGDLGNCTVTSVGGEPSSAGFPIGLLLAIIIGVILGVVIGACLLGVVFICRKGYTTRKREERGAMLRSGRSGPPRSHFLYTDAGNARTLVRHQQQATRDPRDPRDPRADYGYKRPLEASSGSTQEDTPRKVIPDFVQSVVDEGRVVAAHHPCMRNHVYESPKFSQQQQQQQQGALTASAAGGPGGAGGGGGIVGGGRGVGPPLYHELDAADGDERCARHMVDH